MQRNRIESISLAVIAICCLVVASLAAYRQMKPASAIEASTSPERINDWQQYTVGGQRIGAVNGSIKIVEFIDFQCPFCRRLEETLNQIRTQYPSDVEIIYHHYPLESIHPHARAAAIASECAATKGKFHEYVDVLFAAPDSIGRVSWSEFARRIGLVDTVTFAQCLKSEQIANRVADDEALGRKLGVRERRPYLSENGV